MQNYYDNFMNDNDLMDKYITKNEVYNHVYNSIHTKSKTTIQKVFNTNNIINSVINKWEIKYDNFGFYDDYHRGTHERLVKNVQKIIKDKITAIDIIKPHLCRWIMQSLYAPPSHGFKGGSRYLECQKHFKLLYR